MKYYQVESYANQGNYKKAAQYYDQALRANVSEPSIPVKLGSAYFQSGAFRQAETALSEAISKGNNDMEAYLYRGLARNELKDETGASGDLRQAIDKGAKNYQAYYLGILSLNLKNTIWR